MSELKPCPFCGGKAQRMGHAGGIEFFCGNHDCIVQPCNLSTNERDALSAWNTRAVPDVPKLVRYEPDWFEGRAQCFRDRNGEYVLYSQAAEIIAAERSEKHRAQEAVLKLERELAQYEAHEAVPAADLKAENDKLKSQVNNLIDEINDLQETITRLENKYT